MDLRKILLPHLSKERLLLLCVLSLSAGLVSIISVLYSEIFIYAADMAENRFINNTNTIFLLVPVCFLVAAYLCKIFAKNADGGGPDHVFAAIKKLSKNDHNIDKLDAKEYLSLRIILVKFFSSIICIFGGGALGREGPIVQMAASVFYIIGQKTKRFLPPIDLRIWIIIGGSTGIAAAFNTPLAAIIFAVEELSIFKFEQKFYNFRASTLFTIIVAGVTAQFLTGSYILFSAPKIDFVFNSDIYLIIIIAIICGIMAWILKIILNKFKKWRDLASNKSWYLFPLLAAAIVSLTSFYFGLHSFGSGSKTIVEVLHNKTAILTNADFFSKFINVIATTASGAAGGLLIPSMTLGAGVAAIISHIFHFTGDSRILATSGMAAFLSAILNAPITAAVLVLEVTNQRELILPLFLSTLVASYIYHHLEDLYSIKM